MCDHQRAACRWFGAIRLPLFLVLAIFSQLCSAAIAPAADPADDIGRLLRTFRDEFVAIVPGTEPFPADFQMGRDQAPASERPAHRVAMKAFSIARYEVPQNLWQAVMGENPSRWQGQRNSVEMVSFDDAQEFCRRATELLREAKVIGPHEVLRLPSEAQWEYAARAGTTTTYSFGDDAKGLDDYGWYHGNAAGNDPAVGAKKPNAWKLYDLHGYLWEWCADSWHDDYTGAPRDARAWIEGGAAGKHVLRGGSWKDPAERLTSTSRRSAASDLKDDAVGFRCVLVTEAGD